jgi:predicted AAA+ superfamily ATPase
MDFLELNQGLIITNSQEEVIESQGKTIAVKPAWKWLLET